MRSGLKMTENKEEHKTQECSFCGVERKFFKDNGKFWCEYCGHYEGEEVIVIKKTKIKYLCPFCGKECWSEDCALACYEDHKLENKINADFNNGLSLGEIAGKYENLTRYKNLSEKAKTITKNNCFVCYHWALEREPIYKILQLSKWKIRLGGYNKWGKYSCFQLDVNDECFNDPKPKEEFVDYREKSKKWTF